MIWNCYVTSDRCNTYCCGRREGGKEEGREGGREYGCKWKEGWEEETQDPTPFLSSNIIYEVVFSEGKR